jgi:hypothetical protein
LPAFHASHRQSFGNIVVVALRIELWTHGTFRGGFTDSLCQQASLGLAGNVVGSAVKLSQL